MRTTNSEMKKKKFITKGMTPGEFFDRFTILLQKSFFSDDYKKRVEEYVAILDKNGFDGKFLRIICELQIININVWHLESDIRKSREGELGLMEVGRRALKIRNYNRERTKRSNTINRLMGEEEQDEKFEQDS